MILANQSPGANTASVANKFDLDRNGRVNGQDYAILLANQQAAGIVAPITALSARAASAMRGFSDLRRGESSSSGIAATLPIPEASIKSTRNTSNSTESQKIAVASINGVFWSPVLPQRNGATTGMATIDLRGPEMSSAKDKENKDEPSLKGLDSIFASLRENALQHCLEGVSNF